MSSVNKVIVVGNLGKDPDVHSFQNGGKVCNLSVATSERWTDKQSGEAREKTEWHRVAIFAEPLVEVAERYLRRGSKVYLEGQLEPRKYTDQSGTEKYTTEVVLRPFRSQLQLRDPPPHSGSSAAAARDDRHDPDWKQDRRDTSRLPQGGPGAQGRAPSGRPAGAASRRPPPPIDDDDIPF